jgi:putative heme iron utilization protein
MLSVQEVQMMDLTDEQRARWEEIGRRIAADMEARILEEWENEVNGLPAPDVVIDG